MTESESLSVVLPVHNAEKTLSQRVLELLDILPDITSQFELLIVDDGSTDHTEEIAHELARRFPQLHVARHRDRRGPAAALHTGLVHTTGDVVIVQDEQVSLRPSEIRQTWALRHDHGLVRAGTEQEKQPSRSRSPERLVRVHRNSSTDKLRLVPKFAAPASGYAYSE